MVRLGARAMLAGHQLLGERRTGDIVRIGAGAMWPGRYVFVVETLACWFV